MHEPELLNSLIDLILQFHESKSDEKEEKSRLQGCRKEVIAAIDNLVLSVEKGMNYDLVKDRLSALQAQKVTIETKITQLDLESQQTITREQISAYMNKFLAGEIKDLNSDKQIIKDFVNSVIVEDEAIYVSFNYRSSAPVRIPPPIVRANIRVRTTVFEDVVVCRC